MPEEQQAKPGDVGKEAAEELKGKIHADEQQKLADASDDAYGEQFQQHLAAKLKPEIEAFNEQAEFADALQMKASSGLLQFFKDDHPSYALLIKGRELHFLEPVSSTPVTSLRIAGGPEEYTFLGGSGNAAPIAEPEALKGLIRLAAGGKFQAE